MSSFRLVQPDHLSELGFRQIWELIFDAFSNDPMLPYELDEWSLQGIERGFKREFEAAIRHRGMYIARSISEQSQGSDGAAEGTGQEGGDILGFLTVRTPNSSLKGIEESLTTIAPAIPGDRTRPPKSSTLKLYDGESGVLKWYVSPPLHSAAINSEGQLEPWLRDFMNTAFGIHPAPCFHIDFIAVSRKSQGMGIGRSLMAMVSDQAKGLGVQTRLLCANESVVSWYTSLGYTELHHDEIQVEGRMVKWFAMSRLP